MGGFAGSALPTITHRTPSEIGYAGVGHKLLFRKVDGPALGVEGENMPGDVDVSGYVLTREEWLDLDEDVRGELEVAIDESTRAMREVLSSLLEEPTN